MASLRSSRLGMLRLSKYWRVDTGTSRTYSTKPDIFSYLNGKAGLLASRQVIPDTCPSHYAPNTWSKFSNGSRYLSSQAGAESSSIYKGFNFPGSSGKIRLPKSRVLYTVLRSPHIDKKSREQFALETKKELLVIKTEINELRKMSFWLKRLRIFGAQYEMLFSCKTQLEKEKVQRLLGNEVCPNKALARQPARPDPSKKKEEATIRMRICYF